MAITCAQCGYEFLVGCNFCVAFLVPSMHDVAKLNKEGGQRLPNSFVCVDCMAKLPSNASHDTADKAAQPGTNLVIAYSPVDTVRFGYRAFTHVPLTGEFKFVKCGVFVRRLPKAVLEMEIVRRVS